MCQASASLSYSHRWRQISFTIRWLRALALEMERGVNNQQPASDSAHSMNKTFVEINPEMGPEWPRDRHREQGILGQIPARRRCLFLWETANMKASASRAEKEPVPPLILDWCVCLCQCVCCIGCLTFIYTHTCWQLIPFSVLCLHVKNSDEFSPPGGPGVPG